MEREEFEAQIAAAQGDADDLLRISDMLGGRSESWAGKLRIDAIARRLKLRNMTAPAAATLARSPPAPPDWLAAIGIDAPDGRPLYRYRLSREQFVSAQEELGRRAPVIRLTFVVRHIACHIDQ